MCAKCDDIQRRLDRYRRLGSQISDQIAVERFKTAVVELEAERAKMHPKKE